MFTCASDEQPCVCDECEEMYDPAGEEGYLCSRCRRGPYPPDICVACREDGDSDNWLCRDCRPFGWWEERLEARDAARRPKKSDWERAIEIGNLIGMEPKEVICPLRHTLPCSLCALNGRLRSNSNPFKKHALYFKEPCPSYHDYQKLCLKCAQAKAEGPRCKVCRRNGDFSTSAQPNVCPNCRKLDFVRCSRYELSAFTNRHGRWVAENILCDWINPEKHASFQACLRYKGPKISDLDWNLRRGKLNDAAAGDSSGSGSGRGGGEECANQDSRLRLDSTASSSEEEDSDRNGSLDSRIWLDSDAPRSEGEGEEEDHDRGTNLNSQIRLDSDMSSSEEDEDYDSDSRLCRSQAERRSHIRLDLDTSSSEEDESVDESRPWIKSEIMFDSSSADESSSGSSGEEEDDDEQGQISSSPDNRKRSRDAATSRRPRSALPRTNVKRPKRTHSASRRAARSLSLSPAFK